MVDGCLLLSISSPLLLGVVLVFVREERRAVQLGLCYEQLI